MTAEEIKNSIALNEMYDLLEKINAEPRLKNDTIICKTICHEGESHKLYYYDNNKLFHCYTECGSFDIFTLISKIFDYDFIESLYYITSYFGLEVNENINPIKTSNPFKNYENIQKKKEEYEKTDKNIILPVYSKDILDRFIYSRITLWENEGIDKDVIKKNKIGFYLGDRQITIPHYDMNNRLIGIRGRIIDECDLYGKYRPLYINKQLYNHPLGLNLYNLNNSKRDISKCKTAVIFEGEKSTLKMQSLFENDISVACCGSSITDYQISLLRECGAEEIIIAFDRQFQEIGDLEFKRLKEKIIRLYNRYSKEFKISFIFDKNMITKYKDSPIDCGKEIFLQLLDERIKSI